MIDKLALFEVFVPITPVPKSYRHYAGKTSLGQRCRVFQREVTQILEKHREETFDGPLWAEYIFYFTRPLNAKNLRYPERKPDHDNLTKSLQDCIERAGIIKNDSRIVMALTRKVFCSGVDSDGVCQPGIRIRLGKMVSE